MLGSYRADTGPLSPRSRNVVAFGRTPRVPKRARIRHRNIIGCARDAKTRKAMVRNWRAARAEHGAFARTVLAYDRSIRNPAGLRGWAMAYSRSVCESGYYGRPSSRPGTGGYYGLLQGWAYRPPWSGGPVWAASFWAQSVATYNLRIRGGWWEC